MSTQVSPERHVLLHSRCCWSFFFLTLTRFVQKRSAGVRATVGSAAPFLLKEVPHDTGAASFLSKKLCTWQECPFSICFAYCADTTYDQQSKIYAFVGHAPSVCRARMCRHDLRSAEQELCIRRACSLRLHRIMCRHDLWSGEQELCNCRHALSVCIAIRTDTTCDLQSERCRKKRCAVRIWTLTIFKGVHVLHQLIIQLVIGSTSVQIHAGKIGGAVSALGEGCVCLLHHLIIGSTPVCANPCRDN